MTLCLFIYFFTKGGISTGTFNVTNGLGPVPRKMVKLNRGLSQILSKIFLTKNMSLELTKYCFLFTTRLNDDNIEYYSKQCIGR